MRRCGAWIVPLVMMVGLVGCGSNGNGSVDPPPGGGGRVVGLLGNGAAGAQVSLDGTHHQATVGSDGRFQLDDVPPGEYTLAITGGGSTGTAVMVRVSDGETTPVGPVELRPAGQITGIVTARSADGRLTTVAGARVVARYMPLYWDYAGQAPPELGEGLPGAPPSARQDDGEPAPSYPPRVAITDSDGSFRFSAVPEGPYSLDVTAAGHEPASWVGLWVEAGRTTAADVELRVIDPDNATVYGTVQAVVDGRLQPLAHVRVEVWPLDVGPLPGSVDGGEGGVGGGGQPDISAPPVIPDDSDPWYVPPFYEGKSALTNEQGGYRIENLPPGRYQISFLRYGYERIERTVTLSPREQRLESAVLESNLVTLSGRVLGRQENGSLVPLAGAWVNAYGGVYEPMPVPVPGEAPPSDGVTVSAGAAGEPGRPDVWLPPGGAQTDADGRYTLTTEGGYVHVEAWADGYLPSGTRVRISPPGQSGIDLILELWNDDGWGQILEGDPDIGIAVPIWSP